MSLLFHEKECTEWFLRCLRVKNSFSDWPRLCLPRIGILWLTRRLQAAGPPMGQQLEAKVTNQGRGSVFFTTWMGSKEISFLTGSARVLRHHDWHPQDKNIAMSWYPIWDLLFHVFAHSFIWLLISHIFIKSLLRVRHWCRQWDTTIKMQLIKDILWIKIVINKGLKQIFVHPYL